MREARAHDARVREVEELEAREAVEMDEAAEMTEGPAGVDAES